MSVIRSEEGRWWAIPPEKRERYERRQSEFEAGFGDFASVEIALYGVAASPDGKWVGFHFTLRDGTRLRAALSTEAREGYPDPYYQLFAMIALALERCEARRVSTEGKRN